MVDRSRYTALIMFEFYYTRINVQGLAQKKTPDFFRNRVQRYCFFMKWQKTRFFRARAHTCAMYILGGLFGKFIIRVTRNQMNECCVAITPFRKFWTESMMSFSLFVFHWREIFFLRFLPIYSILHSALICLMISSERV